MSLVPNNSKSKHFIIYFELIGIIFLPRDRVGEYVICASGCVPVYMKERKTILLSATDRNIRCTRGWDISILPMKKWSGTNASFKNRSTESVHLKKRSTAILIHCIYSLFETYSFTWLIFETRHFTWSVFQWKDRFAILKWISMINKLISTRFITISAFKIAPWTVSTERIVFFTDDSDGEGQRLLMRTVLFHVVMCFCIY